MIGLGLAPTFVRNVDPFAAFAANGFNPALVAAMDRDLYRGPGSKFADVINATSSGLALLRGSNGEYLWNAHNLINQSKTSSATVGVVGSGGALPTGWTIGGGATVEVTSVSDDEITLSISRDNTGGGGNVFPGIRLPAAGNGESSYSVKFSGGVGNLLNIDGDELFVQLTGTTNTYLGQFTEASNDILIEGVPTADITAVQVYGRILAGQSGSYDITLRKVHLFRSDMGGMANNPDTGDSYVPTDGAAVYLPRLGHHVYDMTVASQKEQLLLDGSFVHGTADFAENDTGQITHRDEELYLERADAGTSQGRELATTTFRNLIIGETYTCSATVLFRSTDVSNPNGAFAQLTFDGVTSIVASSTRAELGLNNTEVISGTFVATATEHDLALGLRGTANGSVTFLDVTVSGKTLGTWVKKGLLGEPSRENRVLESEDMTVWPWVTPSNRASIVKENDWFVLEQVATDFDGSVAQSITVAANETVTISVEAKKRDRDWIFIREKHSDGSANNTFFDILNGAVGTSDPLHIPNIEPLGDGAFRCSITFTNDGTERSATFELYSANEDGLTATTLDEVGNQTLVRLAQVEDGPEPTSHFPTGDSAETRAADDNAKIDALTLADTVMDQGPELVVNGDFSSDANWTLSGPTISGGLLNFTASGQTASQTPAVESGTYLVEIVVDTYVSGGLNVRVGDFVYTDANITGVGTYRMFLTSVGSSTITLQGKSSAELSVSKCSAHLVTMPDAISIAVKALVSYADEGDADQVLLYNWFLDNNNEIVGRIRTDSTRTGEIQVFKRNNGLADAADGSNIQHSPGVNVPAVVASRQTDAVINGIDISGAVFAEDTDGEPIPNLVGQDLELLNGAVAVIEEFAIWKADIGDAGLVEAVA